MLIEGINPVGQEAVNFLAKPVYNPAHVWQAPADWVGAIESARRHRISLIGFEVDKNGKDIPFLDEQFRPCPVAVDLRENICVKSVSPDDLPGLSRNGGQLKVVLGPGIVLDLEKFLADQVADTNPARLPLTPDELWQAMDVLTGGEKLPGKISVTIDKYGNAVLMDGEGGGVFYTSLADALQNLQKSLFAVDRASLDAAVSRSIEIEVAAKARKENGQMIKTGLKLVGGAVLVYAWFRIKKYQDEQTEIEGEAARQKVNKQIQKKDAEQAERRAKAQAELEARYTGDNNARAEALARAMKERTDRKRAGEFGGRCR